MKAAHRRFLLLPKSDVEVSSGHASRHKRLFIRGNINEIRRRIEAWLA